MLSFIANNTYTTRSVCDHNCIFSIKVISRTAKTIKAIVDGELKTMRIRIYNDAEQVKPYGSYSMAPIISAS